MNNCPGRGPGPRPPWPRRARAAAVIRHGRRRPAGGGVQRQPVIHRVRRLTECGRVSDPRQRSPTPSACAPTGCRTTPAPTAAGSCLRYVSGQQVGVSDSLLRRPRAPARPCGRTRRRPRPSAQQQLTDDVKFAQCMRSHGLPNFPDPTNSDGRVVFVISISRDGFDPHSPQVLAKARHASTCCPRLGAAVGAGVVVKACRAESTAPMRPAGGRRGRWVALGLVVVLAAGAVSAWRAGVFSPAASSGAGQQGAPAPATAAVTRQDLSATTPVTATLGYAGSCAVTGQGGGTLTWLPSAGQVIRQGQALYKTGNGSPVVLLYGSVPDWRALDEGITGAGRVPAQPRPGGPRLRRPRGYRRAGLGLLLVGDGVRGAAAGGAPGGLRPAGEPVSGAGGVRAGGAAGQPGDREPGRPGVRAGAGGDLGPARGDDPAGCLRPVGGQGG